MARCMKASALFRLAVFANHPTRRGGEFAWQVLLAGILRAEQEGDSMAAKDAQCVEIRVIRMELRAKVLYTEEIT